MMTKLARSKAHLRKTAEEKTITIDGRVVGTGLPCYLVAEIGINHNGDMELAKKTITAAKEAGAEAVKFQNYYTEDFITDKTLAYEYLLAGKPVSESQFEMFKRCELSLANLRLLKEHCDRVGVSFHSTPTSERGINDLLSLNTPVLKNGSDYLTHLPLVRMMGKTGLPTVLSTGMATVSEIDQSVSAFRETGNENLILLSCTSAYPTPPDEVNLQKLTSLSDTFESLVGFSDHTDGIVAGVGSIVFGSIWLEKHFTLDKTLPGPDHRFSCDKSEFTKLASAIRQIEAMLGSSKLGPTASELYSRVNFRLSCQSAADLPAGHVLKEKDIAFRRPGTGIPPAQVSFLIGRTLKHALKANTNISSDDLN
jgi:N,N'-diacetyllegionaminate synthase